MDAQIPKNQAGRIVVGYDGSASSVPALEWAAMEAQQRGLPLTVLHVVDYAGMIPSPNGPLNWPDVHDEAVARIARDGTALALKYADSIEVGALTRIGSVAGSLIEFSHQAELIVVGTYSHRDLIGAVLGSVAVSVGAHARCPVVVVRGLLARPAPGRPIVVGIDGSSGSADAVNHAAERAAAAGAPLIIVAAYRTLIASATSRTSHSESASVCGPDYFGLESHGAPDFDTVARQSTQAAVNAAVELARSVFAGLGVSDQTLNITGQAFEGAPATVLAEASQHAGLLVVGSRGLGGFAELMLGSVGLALIHSSPCPITIVHCR